MTERNCGTCLHRAYGDQRLISQCVFKALGDPVRAALRKKGVLFAANGEIVTKVPAPRARNFGRKCRRWELQRDGAIPTSLRMVGINELGKPE